MSDNNNSPNTDYYRYVIQRCIEFDKPMIVSGVYDAFCTTDRRRMVVSHIQPFVPEEYVVSDISDHVNILMDGFKDLIQKLSMLFKEKYLFVVRPTLYKDEYGENRGGLILTDELKNDGFKPISKFSYDMISKVPYDKIVDFRKEFSAIYAWKKDFMFNRNTDISSESSLPEKAINNLQQLKSDLAYHTHNMSFIFTYNIEIPKKVNYNSKPKLDLGIKKEELEEENQYQGPTALDLEKLKNTLNGDAKDESTKPINKRHKDIDASIREATSISLDKFKYNNISNNPFGEISNKKGKSSVKMRRASMANQAYAFSNVPLGVTYESENENININQLVAKLNSK